MSNNSALPYEVDFIRFYIRDLKTVSRMATHEQEIVPLIVPALAVLAKVPMSTGAAKLPEASESCAV